MREFTKVSPKFWLGATGRCLRGHVEAQLVAFYLLTNPHANMIGLYYLPLSFISHETGLTIEGALKGLARAIEGDFCRYDEATETVWVIEMARYQVGDQLKAEDKRVKGIQNEYDNLPQNPFLADFFDKYKERFHLSSCRSCDAQTTRGLEGASMPHRSTETETETERLTLASLARTESTGKVGKGGGGGKPAAPKFDPLTLDLPAGLSLPAWRDWIAYRRSRKLTLTEATIRAQLAKLGEWAAAGHDPDAVIAASVENGWQGLFEPKGAPGFRLGAAVPEKQAKWDRLLNGAGPVAAPAERVIEGEVIEETPLFPAPAGQYDFETPY